MVTVIGLVLLFLILFLLYAPFNDKFFKFYKFKKYKSFVNANYNSDLYEFREQNIPSTVSRFL